MYLENTLHWYMSGQHTEYIKLNKGENSLKVAATGSKGKASIDCMYLTYVGAVSYTHLPSAVFSANLRKE